MHGLVHVVLDAAGPRVRLVPDRVALGAAAVPASVGPPIAAAPRMLNTGGGVREYKNTARAIKNAFYIAKELCFILFFIDKKNEPPFVF